MILRIIRTLAATILDTSLYWWKTLALVDILATFSYFIFKRRWLIWSKTRRWRRRKCKLKQTFLSPSSTCGKYIPTSTKDGPADFIYFQSISNSLINYLSSHKIWQINKKIISNSLLNMFAKSLHLPSRGAARIFLHARTPSRSGTSCCRAGEQSCCRAADSDSCCRAAVVLLLIDSCLKWQQMTVILKQINSSKYTL